ncbi:MAG: preprotein translocase subunit SecE [Corynebacterium sp.]|nr:preprotein translocase subunit SecE [Corynebacterium sp.]
MADDNNPENLVGVSRPAGKRQVSKAATSSAEYAARRVAKSNARKDEGPGGSVATFLPEVVQEMRKVIWPTARQMVIYTAIVFAFLIILTALVSGIDFLAGLGVEKVLTP